jgi:PTS system mannitol-specific IIC component
MGVTPRVRLEDISMATTTSTPGARTGARVHVQKFGTFLSNMVMPNIGAFIAWGLITALFIEVGWLPKLGIGDSPGSWVADIGGWGDNAGGGIVGPMITYLLPILIGYTGGKMLYDTRGGVVGAIATMGIIAGTEIPMFMGAMIMGPLGGWSMKHIDAIWDGKIKPGFEMLVDNFAAGIWGGILATFGYFVMSPIVTWISDRLGEGVDWLVNNDVLPLTSLIIEPAKVLFLNNAINHGVLTPLGTAEAVEQGKSVLFLLEANPGPGLGLLTAYMVFGRGLAKASAPGAAIIHFLGGIHEIYFPYVLMKPKLIVAMIAGGMTGVFLNVLFDVGLRAPAAPGSIFAVYAQTASDSYLGVTIAVLGAAAVTFLVAGFLLRTDKAEEADDQLVHATASMEAMKGKQSIASTALAGTAGTATATREITSIVFACDAGMGSSAMGATVLRNKIKKAGIDSVTVTNKAIANLSDDVDLVITHQDLTDRAKLQSPSALHVSVDNFMNSPKYDEIVNLLESEGVR